MTATRRWFSPWLAALFVRAQIVSEVLLPGGHTEHVAAAASAVSLDHAKPAPSRHGHHHHRGGGGGFLQHHELQDLSGAFPSLIGCGEIAFIAVAMTAHGLLIAIP